MADDTCPNGHPWTPQTEYISPKGRRRCRTCMNESERRRRAYEPPTVEARFWAKVEFTGFCWLWTATLREGYGRFQLGKRQLVDAHRLAYEWLVHVIPPGLQIDHLCRIRNCVNPDHLEPVTQPVNYWRSPAVAGRKTHCPKGHPYSGDNLYILPGSGGRVCRECTRAGARRRYHAARQR